jgi:hypothetical protein
MALIAAGCSNSEEPDATNDIIDLSDNGDEDDPDEPDEGPDDEPDPEDEEEPEEADPFAIPDDPADIDEAYIDLVTNELFAIESAETSRAKDCLTIN